MKLVRIMKIHWQIAGLFKISKVTTVPEDYEKTI